MSNDSNDHADMQALAKAFELFTQTTQSWEESYRLLEARVRELDNELASKNQELALTNDYLDSILEGMSDGVIAVDTHGTIIRFNRAATHVLGYSAEEATGKPFREVFGRVFSLPGDRRIRELRARDGSAVPVSERDAPLRDRGEQLIGWVKVFQDLSELETLREQVRHKDRLAAVGELAATVAHEIRNPLGGIRGFAALLQRDLPNGDPKRRLVDKILAGAQDLDEVVSELLEFTRPLQLRLRPTACRDLVDAALAYMDPVNGGVTFQRDVPADMLVQADPDRMRQVLLNILLNAVQSMNGEPGRIAISAFREGEHVAMCIADTGCGMPEDKLKQAFSPFFTTKEKGTGLGLAVAEKIVEGHGGHVNARSVVGEGSQFYIYLPEGTPGLPETGPEA